MNGTLTFDTLAYSKRLRQAGFTEQQAEVQAEALAHVIDERLATKDDIVGLKRDLKEMEMRLTIKLGTMLVIAIGIFATLIKVL
ncbi:MAG: DUF1640 domain-containing protein [Verrucomicrobia bacterium]|jgi:hypothetical protein|nr:DUF1640 domain-containing protein [Verrucomicrobiota bacterium]